MTVTLLGVRHHGPGSARAVRAALEQVQPDAILVEGPPEAEALLAHVPGLVPPVALLAHQVDDPGRAAFWPYADFSPEWQAISYGEWAGVRVRFCDLPAATTLALDRERDDSPEEVSLDPEQDESSEQIRLDPLGWLSIAAGHDDPERWWEDVVEHRLGGDPIELFAGIAEAMSAVRGEFPETSPHDARREAHMRTAVRTAAKKGFERIVVVCGAWHVPALAANVTAKADAVALRGLPKSKVSTTWVPWTSRRLDYGSGYGAGVAAPGWYLHLWRAPDAVAERWVVRAAGLLRGAGRSASPASVVDTVRLAEALAAVRGRSLPGLSELDEAMESVLCEGDPFPLQIIREQLVVGFDLGEVPDTVPTVALQADIDRTCRRLRMKPSAVDRKLELDLRKETDLARSHLLHRLRLLDLPWGTSAWVRGTGTFKEAWSLCWKPEFAVRVVEVARYGTTVPAAATALVRERAAEAADLPAVTRLVEVVVLADLPDALGEVTGALEERSARTGDVVHLLAALPPLARVLRYGSVRQVDTSLVQPVVDSLLVRIAAGLPLGCVSLDGLAEFAVHNALQAAEDAVRLVATPEQLAAWYGALRSVADLRGARGSLAGHCVRLLYDANLLDGEDVGRRLSRALSAAQAPNGAVLWLIGLLDGSGILLLRDDVLWGVLDDWLTGLVPAHFDEVLALLRRAFAGFPDPERRAMGERVRRGSGRSVGAAPEPDWDADRVALIRPILATVLGVPGD